ncbi:MAG: VWA domain-containing protein [Motiliproteus sp.]
MKKSNRLTTATSSVDQFLAGVDQHPTPSNKALNQTDTGCSGRLIFALDATASRQPTWDSASQLQAEMFSSTQGIGQLQVKLCFYRGFGELRFSPWHNDADKLIRAMSAVQCRAGQTQIRRLLEHALKLQQEQQDQQRSIQALVFIGDCIEESVDQLCQLAGQCGLLRLPLFLFQEGNDPVASSGFSQMARLSKGAHCRFDLNSPERLKELLNAVAIYATGGAAALLQYQQSGSTALQQLTQQLIQQSPRQQTDSSDK